MTLPNRIASLRVREPLTTAPTRFVYATPQFVSNRFAAGEWYMAANRAARRPPQMASNLVTVDDISLAFDDSLAATPDQSLIVAGSQVFIFGPSGMLTYDVVSNTPFSLFGYFYLTVSGGALTGEDFEIIAGLTVGFSGIQSLQQGPLADRTVWARISERGSERGILAIQTTEEVTTVTDTAEFVIPFIDPSTYASLISITDDLARTWTIRSFRAIEDRLYMALECERDAG